MTKCKFLCDMCGFHKMQLAAFQLSLVGGPTFINSVVKILIIAFQFHLKDIVGLLLCLIN